jgi:hypothetical protein
MSEDDEEMSDDVEEISDDEAGDDPGWDEDFEF